MCKNILNFFMTQLCPLKKYMRLRYNLYLTNMALGGVPAYDFAKNFQKLHEIERIWAPGVVQNITM